MNQREFQALGASELDPMAVVLYVRTFRRLVNEAAGTDVITTKHALERAMEFHSGCEDYLLKIQRPTWKRVMELERQLTNAGLIELLRIDGEQRVYRCLLSSGEEFE